MKISINYRMVAVLLIICLGILSLTGCWDRFEIEDMAFVGLIGIDKVGKNKFEVTYKISNPQGGGFSNVVGSSAKEPAAEIITIQAVGPLSARDTANASVTRKLSFTHASVLVVGEEMARSDEFLAVLDGMLRDKQIRRNIFLVISREKASEFIRGNAPKLETRPHKFYDFMSERWQDTALVPLATLNELIKRNDGHGSLFLAVYGTVEKQKPKEEVTEDDFIAGEVPIEGGNPVQMIGAAVFKGTKMIGTLTGEEVRLSLILRQNEKLPSFYSTFSDPIKSEYRITVRVSKTRQTKIKINVKDKQPRIEITVPISMELLSIPSGVNYVEDLDKQKLLKETIEKQLAQKAMKLVEKTEKEFGGEPFKWSILARREFGTWGEFKRYDWENRYTEAEVTVQYNVTIKGVGKQLQPPNDEEAGGGQ
ncbi:Ger(x)C family spore germination protein [Petroclostridium sp. X23]|uniref:Ger(x)C family spore germination protein n=1 Tax=Petroclostridium sp. X23 TaxID=3045146 RepID=UPI0024AE8207|nr:Ger(x)C family spore germination protein [Petroclostridium sp. X23]WHH58588.1 Ger(x)C family spore germination protein [Petroclostridium sp. X23]